MTSPPVQVTLRPEDIEAIVVGVASHPSTIAGVAQLLRQERQEHRSQVPPTHAAQQSKLQLHLFLISGAVPLVQPLPSSSPFGRLKRLFRTSSFAESSTESSSHSESDNSLGF